jgi:hypothetical protein
MKSIKFINIVASQEVMLQYACVKGTLKVIPNGSELSQRFRNKPIPDIVMMCGAIYIGHNNINPVQ